MARDGTADGVERAEESGNALQHIDQLIPHRLGDLIVQAAAERIVRCATGCHRRSAPDTRTPGWSAMHLLAVTSQMSGRRERAG